MTKPLLQSGCLLFCSLIASMPAVAQEIKADGTTSTTVTSPDGNNFMIEGGDRPEGGANLFHSFQDFSVPTGGSAFFNNANEIVNIFSRVTGGKISNIDGLIRGSGSANLFLINPAGIIFGQNARLDLGGSFLGSTADSILFEDSSEFIATDGQNQPLLTINAPTGLRFRDNPQPIINRSFVRNSTDTDFVGLAVRPGANFTLVGGEIKFEDGEATAPGGRVDLGGLSESGIITINENGSLNFPKDVARANVTFNNFADVDVRGAGNGNITVNARNINLSGESGSTSLRAGIAANLGSAEAQAGDITLNATETIKVDNSIVSNIVSENASGNGGNLYIETRSLSIINIGALFVDTRGSGDAGKLTITTEQLIVQNSLIGAGTFDRGQGGTITVNASESVELIGTPGERIPGGLTTQTQSIGDAGDLTVETKRLIVRDGASIKVSAVFDSSGDAGNLTINTENLIIENAQIGASTFSQGNSGNLDIIASESIELIGTNQGLEEAPSGVFAQTNPESSGISGSLTIETKRLSARDGGQVSVTSLGTGEAGDLTIRAFELVELVSTSANGEIPSGLFAATQVAGNAGDLNIVTEQLIVRDGAEISANSEGEGTGGSLFLRANSLTLDGQASIVAATESNEGGNITLQIADNLTLRDNSTINAQAFGTADGGNIDIDTDFIIAFPSNGDGNDIIASAEQGRGGNINITAESVFNIKEREAIPGNGTNDIDASSEFGLDGNVSIFTPDINTLQTDIELPNNIVEPETLGANACSGGRGTETSSFRIKGKGGIPPLPTEPFMADALIPDGKPITIDKETNLNSLLEGRIEQKQANPHYLPAEIKPIKTSMGDIYPARGIIKTEDGKIILTRYPTAHLNTRTPHISANCSLLKDEERINN